MVAWDIFLVKVAIGAFNLIYQFHGGKKNGMNVGSYSFEEFRRLTENFHGYAAPGVLIGGYMVAMAKSALPEGTLFEAVSESAKCLPDAVQLLTLCSTGNQRLKVHDLGRYAVTLFDKYSGEGVRVSLDPEKMAAFPELYAWFFKKKPKREQDSARLEEEIRKAGDTICKLRKVRVKKRFIGAKHMSGAAICPVCGEGYPAVDGDICRGCQGEEAVISSGLAEEEPDPVLKIVPVEEAPGRLAAHDMTRIEPGQFKGPEFKAGQLISPGDVCRLQSMGRFHVAVRDDAPKGGLVHENEVALAFASRMAGPGVTYADQPKEGKIDFRAARDGLFRVNRKILRRFNLSPLVMAACRHDATLVREGEALAGTRAIPLYLSGEAMEAALAALENGPLFQVLPLRSARVGILVTGTEVFQGLIEDRFIPVISSKITALGSVVVKTAIVPDDKAAMTSAIQAMAEKGVDLLVTTGGLSVDPDDVTRQALLEAGLTDPVHGIPVLPGAMSLVGRLGKMQVLGVPACALYFKTTFLDLILPRLLAGEEFTRHDAVDLAEGGYCLGCKTCSWPHCGFGK